METFAAILNADAATFRQ